MSKGKYRLIVLSSITLFLIGVSLIIYAAYLQSKGLSDLIFNLFGITFFIIMIIVLVLFLSNEEQMSLYQMKKKEERLKKGFLSTYLKDDTKALIYKRLNFHGFQEINHDFYYLKRVDKLLGHSEFYVKFMETNDLEKSIKEVQELFKNVRIVGPSYGKLIRNCVLIILSVDSFSSVDMDTFKEHIDRFISLEQFGDVFIPFIYNKETKHYYFRNVAKKIYINRFYFGTNEFKKFVFGSRAKISSTLKNKQGE